MPLDAGRNTTPQYLMLQSIGEPRTYEHILEGLQFAGGFPEIYFELFGPFYAWPFIFGAGYIAAGLTALIVKGVIQGRYASTFLAFYVLFGFYVMYIGGMLNFVVTRPIGSRSRFAYALALEAALRGSECRWFRGHCFAFQNRLAEVGSSMPFSLTRASKSPRENWMTEHSEPLTLKERQPQ